MYTYRKQKEAGYKAMAIGKSYRQNEVKKCEPIGRPPRELGRLMVEKVQQV